MHPIRSLLVLLAFIPVGALAQAQPRYTMERLGEGSVLAMNDSGWIVGRVGEVERSRPFVQVGGERRYLEGLTGANAYRVNPAGAVVGTQWEVSSRSSFAFLWRDGRTTRLPVPDGMGSSEGWAVNGRGDVVGSGGPYASATALLWSGDSVRTLPPLIPGGRATAYAINDAGWIVGAARAANGEPHAVLWRDGRVEDLGTLGAAALVAKDVNERGQVLVDAQMAMGPTRVLLWESGRLTDLTPLGTLTHAVAMNDSGQVIGHVTRLPNAPRPVLWDRGQVLYLDELVPADAGVRLVEVRDINNRGWILGMVERPDGKAREVVLLKPAR